jgi:hypothetical protein
MLAKPNMNTTHDAMPSDSILKIERKKRRSVLPNQKANDQLLRCSPVHCMNKRNSIAEMLAEPLTLAHASGAASPLHLRHNSTADEALVIAAMAATQQHHDHAPPPPPSSSVAAMHQQQQQQLQQLQQLQQHRFPPIDAHQLMSQRRRSSIVRSVLSSGTAPPLQHSAATAPDAVAVAMARSSRRRNSVLHDDAAAGLYSSVFAAFGGGAGDALEHQQHQQHQYHHQQHLRGSEPELTGVDLLQQRRPSESLLMAAAELDNEDFTQPHHTAATAKKKPQSQSTRAADSAPSAAKRKRSPSFSGAATATTTATAASTTSESQQVAAPSKRGKGRPRKVVPVADDADAVSDTKTTTALGASPTSQTTVVGASIGNHNVGNDDVAVAKREMIARLLPALQNRAAEAPPKPCFRLAQQPNELQRKSYANENRYIHPSPVIVEYCGTLTPLLGGVVGVRLAKETCEVLAQDFQLSLVGDRVRPLDEVGRTGFQLKLLRTSLGSKLRLVFDITYFVGAQCFTELLVSRAFRVDSNRPKSAPDENSVVALMPPGGAAHAETEVWIKGTGFSGNKRIKVLFDGRPGVVIETCPNLITVLAPARPDLTANKTVAVVVETYTAATTTAAVVDTGGTSSSTGRAQTQEPATTAVSRELHFTYHK